MRKEVQDWWKQATRDLESAEKNLRLEECLTAFLCQQSVEKALKALYMHKLKELPSATHSLIFLGRSVGIPANYYSALRKLTPDFVIARYPNAAQTSPYELYDEEIAQERLKMAREVVDWVREELEK